MDKSSQGGGGGLGAEGDGGMSSNGDSKSIKLTKMKNKIKNHQLLVDK